MTDTTSGQLLTAELRRFFRIGTRTRRHRESPFGGTDDLDARMVEEIKLSATIPGPGGPDDALLRPGWAAVLSHRVHYLGYRVDPTLRRHVELMTAWQFSALLGRMLDAGATNVGEGERFFRQMARELHQASTGGGTP
jgi:hypothetical protein